MKVSRGVFQKLLRGIAVGSAILVGVLGWSSQGMAQEPSGQHVEEHDVFYFNQAVPPPEGGTAGIRVEGIGPMVEHEVRQTMTQVGPIIGQAVGQVMTQVGQQVGQEVGSAMTQAFTYVSAVGPGGGKLITGAPYSAQSSTETVQMLADGNRIIHKNTAMLYRDSQGRTRRDQTLDAIGPFGSASNPPNLTFITDPVAKLQYVLDNNTRTARQMPLRGGSFGDGPLPPPMPLPMPQGGEQNVMIFRGPNGPGMPPGGPMAGAMSGVMTGPMGPPPGMPMGGMAPGVPPMNGSQFPAPVNEDLAKQSIEGVETTGTRTTVTFPAGTFGNELPIQVVSERWYSDALQEVILSTHSDPRMGKTTYRLTSISRNEPAPSMFEVPSGYTIVQPPIVSATGFADCAAAGNPVTESMPRQCRAADGKTYVEPPPAGSGPRPFNVPFPPR